MNNTLTPTPVIKPNGMTFPEAIAKLIEGKRIARLSWLPDPDYGVLRDGWVTIFHKKEDDRVISFHKWTMNEGDLNGDDWIVLPDIN
jgi:hypothetical protein